jgi:hypothetical protein
MRDAKARGAKPRQPDAISTVDSAADFIKGV